MAIALRAFLIWAFVWLLPTLALMCVLYVVATYPLRRRERTRLFLDLLATGLGEGRSVEQTIVSVSESHSIEVGARFHLMAAYLEQGVKFQAALRIVETGLPAPILAVLGKGSEAVELSKLLPAAARMLEDGSSRAHSSINYLMLVLMIFTPGLFLVVPALHVFVWPKLEQILADLEVAPPGLTRFIFTFASEILVLYGVALVCFCGIAFIYLANPSIFGKGRGTPRLWRDSLLWKVPWVRKRIMRNFSLMLATFLDSGLPEEKCLELAGESTANLFFLRRVQKSIDKLKQGISLVGAVEPLDPTGELTWRLANAAHGKRDFERSLAGWHEMLESKAFQAEQAAAHIISSSFIIVNGAFVALFISAIFLALIAVIDEGVLW